MAKPKTKQTIYEKTKEVVDVNGNVKLSQTVTKSILPREPEFVKIYLRTVLVISDLPTTLHPVLLKLLELMTYAGGKNGGQIIVITQLQKKEICEELNIKPSTLAHAITDFVKTGILTRLERSNYQVNPYYFGKGDWKDIYKLQEIEFRGTLSPKKPKFKAEFKTEDENDE